MKTYTVSEVIELQNQRKQLEQRLAIHRQRAEEKKKELKEIFAAEGVSNLQELSDLCAKLNSEMQQIAEMETSIVQQMRKQCDELDRML